MGAIKLDSFLGMMPTKDTLLLPQNAAEDCADVWLANGTLRGWSSPIPVHSLRDPTAQVVFRIPFKNEAGRRQDWDNSVWIEFADVDTDVVLNPLADDRHGRVYWTSPSHPVPHYNPAIRITSGSDPLVLGVPAPGDALDVQAPASDNVAPPTVRAYAFTYVTEYGEEGSPSPAVTRTGNQLGTWAVTFPPVTSLITANRQIAKRRLYRTMTGSSGTAEFVLVGEYGLDQLFVSDDRDDSYIASASPLQSATWSPPPALMGMVSLPNGVIAGWTDNDEVWFCEPYRPHAWPAKYVMSFPYHIVGLGVSGASLFVLTSTTPYVVSGPNPGSYRREALQFDAPCLSRHSITSSQDGVHFASNEGLISASGGMVFPASFQFAQRQDWLAAVNPYDFRARRIGTTYVALTGSGNGVMIDGTAGRTVFAKITQRNGWTNILADLWTGCPLLIGGGKVWAMDGAPDQYLPCRWRSKVWHISKPDNLAAVKVFFRTSEGLPALGHEVVSPGSLEDDMWGIFRLYTSTDGGATMRLAYSRELRQSGTLFKLPSGFKSEFWQIEIEGRVEVTGVQIASTVKELAAV
jgi:hypothetical protein